MIFTRNNTALLLLLFTILIVSCRPAMIYQRDKSILEKASTLTVGESFQVTENDSVIETIVLHNAVQISRKRVASPYQNTRVYYKDTRTLKADVNYFHRIPIGIGRKYDSKGKIIEEKDWDKAEARTFTISMLISKMKDDFNIDLLNTTRIGVDTSYLTGIGYTYVIHVLRTSIHGNHRRIVVDATTGEVLADEVPKFIK